MDSYYPFCGFVFDFGKHLCLILASMFKIFLHRGRVWVFRFSGLLHFHFRFIISLPLSKLSKERSHREKKGGKPKLWSVGSQKMSNNVEISLLYIFVTTDFLHINIFCHTIVFCPSIIAFLSHQNFGCYILFCHTIVSYRWTGLNFYLWPQLGQNFSFFFFSFAFASRTSTFCCSHTFFSFWLLAQRDFLRKNILCVNFYTECSLLRELSCAVDSTIQI